MNRLLCFSGMLALVSPSTLAQGGCGADGPILTRTELLARLGSNAVLEGFETYAAPSGGAILYVTCLDDSTVAFGQGPDLVQPGARYCDPAGYAIVWNADQYFGLTTQTIESYSAGEIRILYTEYVTAMGVDLLAFWSYPYSGTATIYDTAGSVVGTVPFTLTTGGSERFFVGWANSTGIGRVDIVSSTYSWSPVIDDHAYGNCIQWLGLRYCFGDGLDPLVTTLCPCANFGLAGRGCANAANAHGARLSGSGTTIPDTAQLTSEGEPATSLSLFLQGTTTDFAGVLFGDGVRCVTGSLLRLYVHNAAGGSVTAPTGSDLSITARSAQLGDTIQPGTVRYYQVYYRDPNLAFCTGAGFNVGNALRITW